ncbi:MAG: DUF2095 family protein [Promethearchaeota archaeon]
MDDKDKKEKKAFKPPLIDDEKGLTISYDKEELKKYLPHLMRELNSEEEGQTMNLHEISDVLTRERSNEQLLDKEERSELINPGALDFIRRCSKKEEAVEILDFLLKRKEIENEEYNDIMNKLNQEDGLRKLIEECGGFKRPGYYEKKFYLRRFYLGKNVKKINDHQEKGEKK